jgi:hypothetical protein
VLPMSAYTLLLIAAILLRAHPRRVLFLVGITSLQLLFIGIHNAWDTVTYITVDAAAPLQQPEEKDLEEQGEPDPPTSSFAQSAPADE